MKKSFSIFRSLFLILSGLCLILLMSDCAVNPVTGKKQLMFMSESQEIALGTQYDPSVVSTFGLYHDEDLQNFLNVKCEEMGKISHRPNLEYHIKILDSPVVNAFAVPGGYIYLTRGILAQFNNEAELIGVLGHEMGHITARHSASQQSKQQMGQILLAGGMIVSEDFRQYAGYAMQGMQLLFLKFSRDNEREADRLGVEYTSKVGYDASKMADFFQVLKKMQMGSSHAGVPTFMSTHPDPGDRYNSVARSSKQWQDSLKIKNWKVNKNNYLDMIDGMVYGNDPRQGFVEGNMFFHPELGFSFPFPQGWGLENGPTQVQIAPEDGRAVMLFSLSKEANAASAAQATVKNLQLTVMDTKERIIHGNKSVQVISSYKEASAETGIQVFSTFIENKGRVYVFHGLTSETDFAEFVPKFEGTMVQFMELKDQKKLNIQPRRINVKTVQGKTTLATALKRAGVSDANMKEMTLLNNMEPGTELNTGDKYKVIR